jgi:hypothetical protein
VVFGILIVSYFASSCGSLMAAGPKAAAKSGANALRGAVDKYNEVG